MFFMNLAPLLVKESNNNVKKTTLPVLAKTLSCRQTHRGFLF